MLMISVDEEEVPHREVSANAQVVGRKIDLIGGSLQGNPLPLYLLPAACRHKIALAERPIFPPLKHTRTIPSGDRWHKGVVHWPESAERRRRRDCEPRQSRAVAGRPSCCL